MKEIPLGDRVIVKVIDTGDKKTASGLILSEFSKTRQHAEVIAVGNGLFTSTGDKIPMTVSVGDTVTFTANTGTEIKVEGEDYRILRESDLFTYYK